MSVMVNPGMGEENPTAKLNQMITKMWPMLVKYASSALGVKEEIYRKTCKQRE